MNKEFRKRSMHFRPANLKSAVQNLKWLGLFAIFLVLTLGEARTEAQQTEKVHRIGYLNATPRTAGALAKARTEALLHGLRELGHVEGKNIVIEWRYGDGTPVRVNELAAELARLNVDVIVTAGGAATRAAKKATVTIPIIMTQDTDPVGNGFVASLARPGGNVTGLSRLAPELSRNQLELLKEIVPRLSRVAVFGRSTSPANARILKEIELAAGGLGAKLQYLDIRSPEDIEPAFRAATNERADAGLMLLAGPVLNPNRTQIIELAGKSRLPVIYRNREDVEAGGLISYGVHLPNLDRRAAIYVDKILKGAKPAELPVEQATKFDLVINLKTAKQIGLTIPPEVLFRADKVIR